MHKTEFPKQNKKSTNNSLKYCTYLHQTVRGSRKNEKNSCIPTRQESKLKKLLKCSSEYYIRKKLSGVQGTGTKSGEKYVINRG